MTWLKLDDGFYDHPKFIDLSDAAMALWIKAAGYCSKHLTDGSVSPGVAARFGSADAALELQSAGLWDGVDSGWVFHDWADYQPSRDEVLQGREASKRRVQEWRAARKAEREAPTCNGVRTENVPSTNTVRNSVRTGAPTRPDPTRPDPEELQKRQSIPDGIDASEIHPPEVDANPSTVVHSPNRPDVDALCTHLADLIEKNGSPRPSITKKWRDSARLMIDRDGRASEDIHRAIEWSQCDEFWRTNILSMPKLREKYDQMRLQASRTKYQPRPRHGLTEDEWAAAMARAEAKEGTR